jgi:hypothetical protein
MFFVGPYKYIGKLVRTHDTVYDFTEVREVEPGYYVDQSGKLTTKLIMMPIIPFYCGADMKGVSGPIIPISPDIEHMPVLLQQALEESLSVEQDLVRRNSSIIVPTIEG